MIDNKFAVLTQHLLLFIADQIESQDIEGNIDVELQDGILKIEIGVSTFIINKNSAAKEIWLSSPISGPHHFALRDTMWKTKKGAELFSLLEEELNVKFVKTNSRHLL